VSAARRLARKLKRAGVQVSGDIENGTAPATAVDVAQVQSAPMSAIVAAMNGPSDNYLAEMLLKGLGAAHGSGGTTAAGAAAARAALDDIGVRPRIVDGSGLSRSDRTTPRQVVRLLQRVANMEFAQPFTASLPVAGVSGTLQRRMRGTAAGGNCRAKTGTLRYTSNLAGYCTTGDGGVVAFALLMNGVNVGAAHGIQDRIAAALAGWDGTDAGPDAAPPPAPAPAAPETEAGGGAPAPEPH
jgi:serine-type D-Ala-D-Ala carboxypeptidase/endopeptidase (penicillin-binding protein 4)